MNYVVVFAASLFVAMALIALRLRFADHGLDVPGERSLHVAPTPHGGGVAIVLVALATGAWAGVDAVWLLAIMVLAVVSMLDDWRGLPFAPRLAVHLLVAASVVFVAHPGGLVAGLTMTIAIAWATNAYNFMDGADGLAGAMALVGFTAYGAGFALAGHGALALMCIAVAGGAAGFLRYNWHPARIFMGDVGAIPLGFMAGGFGWVGAVAGAWPVWFGPMVFAPFLLDATWTLARRALRGERVWQAHREHVYQRMVRAGMGHGRMCRHWALAMAGGAALALLMRMQAGWGWAVFVLWCAGLIFCGRRVVR
ncbi:MraY family glycosyltransferase [Pseudazoarcus pumilus]|uniref:Glycosyl transferase n=1 Tax=Pseudazoarcus pumilus TaxID=2067960 RepID=A0A2I6S935_9RHOO|nr:glycosyltransferase family 4 protein [Pseudazoarcus pumilus]AUN95765.1 glycosyl transferase [Pseudazoarcus pumilus]